ncbi:thymidylate kinase, variant [Sphaeroforma arctica JP610]|uniref:Thymidylate kinase n=1 Tax=Sphaeroforma arctica JP610 TaxID=667725 RepID=A0A0L0G0L3_9EUKA|nr:thymidylate kinase, variant [Sphaeroforma arctica JP610]KNC82590.1 thymidylate kinase, variant [Sphaeroforma arctica JP610]|eukprot:XP_014156492.1 thymidylate kinase, variant [Sphaeroforma arctica JP610]
MMGSTIRRGTLIVLEGCDRSGKSTQARMLVDSLTQEGHPSKLMRFPDRTTTLGKTINDYLTSAVEMSDQAIHLLFSANRWEAMKQMEADLNAGTTLVVDRYAFSGVAFTAAKGLDLQWCKNPDTGLYAPDVTIYMDLPVDEAMRRGGFGEERYEKEDFQNKVGQVFMQLRTPEWKYQPFLSCPVAHACHWKLLG